ncbi:hypothetical protein SNE35_22015 [Paucibacter sp. R3-3]|uniref:Uncharacterized protein n=1 Tax=Roseateles agri TaxID=3098619 RepID=A0ABU5DN94_9BURK|nr:hypothetical protein [Paucibacter sp. R3-3]MDY0747198.1 hypothetical protein [Paucibacter sp. R3-3]
MASISPETKVGSKRRANGSDDVQLPHERDESVGADSTSRQGTGAAGEKQRCIGRQAADDLQQGQVDTDLHATPGLDAERRGRIAGPPAKRSR